ncbi:MAG: 4Fe-4S binding protein [Actinomycetota bacterium]
MAETVYVELREFLDRLPGGYPETPTGKELDILRKFFTPEEAELTMKLRQFPEPAGAIAKRLGIPVAEAEEKLESMARKGLILSVRSGKDRFYQAAQFVVGIHEFHVDSIDREYVELAEEIDGYFADTVVKQFRVVPVNSAVETTTTIGSYDMVREMVKGQTEVAVADCICRKAQHLVDKGCDKPRESCLIFGLGARYYIDYGKGRKIDVDEALRIIDRAEEAGLVLAPSNCKEIINICCCCSCCCGVLKLLKMHERPAEAVYTNFQARIDADLCNECETCVERCQMEALVSREGSMRVDPDRCIGCGLCVSTCPSGAMSLISRPSDLVLPEGQMHMTALLARDRGLGFGKLAPLMKGGNDEASVRRLPLLYRSGLGRPLVNFMAKRGWV